MVLSPLSQNVYAASVISFQNPNPYYEEIYIANTHKIFNQTDIVSHPSFKNLTAEQKKGRLHSKYWETKEKLKQQKFWQETNPVLYSSAAIAMASAVLQRQWSFFSGARNLNIFIFGVGVKYAHSIAVDFCDAYHPLGAKKSSPSNELDVLELQYVEEKHLLSQEKIEFVEESIEKIRSSYSPDMSSKGLEFIRFTLAFPNDIKEIDFDNALAKNSFSEQMAGYSDEVVDKLKSFAISHALESTPDNQRNMSLSKVYKKHALYLYGGPGLGKTRSTKKLAQILDVPISILSIAGNTIEDLIGDENGPGVIYKAILSAKNSDNKLQKNNNMILVLDDADRTFNADYEGSYEMLGFMLKLLDPQTSTYYNPYFGRDIDISKLAIIITGNSELKDEAIKNRVTEVKFEDFHVNYKIKAAKEELIPNISKNYENFITHEDGLSDEEWKSIESFIINNSDKDPGFREIEKFIIKTFNRKIENQLFGE